MPKGLDYLINLKDGDLSGTGKAKKELEGLDNAVEHSNANMTGFGSTIGKVGGLLAGAFAIDQIASLGNDIIQVRGEFQGFENLLANQFGPSAEKVFSDIKSFAKSSPFEVDQLTEAFLKLQGSGFNPTIEKMEQLGNIAAAKNKSFDQLTEAIMDAQTGEFERLKEFQIRASKSGDQVTLSYQGVAKTMKMSQSAIEDYILGLGELDSIKGAMIAKSDTFIGRQSNENDMITEFKNMIGKDLEPVINDYLDARVEIIKSLQDGWEWTKKNKDMLIISAEVIGIAAGAYLTYRSYIMATELPMKLMAAGQWAINAAMTANPIGLIVAGIAAFTGGIILAYKHSETFRASIDGLTSMAKELWSVIKETFGAFSGGISKLFDGDIVGGLKDIGKALVNSNPIGLAINEGKRLGNAFNKGYDDSLAASKASEKNGMVGSASGLVGSASGKGKTPSGVTAGAGTGKGKDSTTISSGTSVRNVQVTINKLVETLQVHTTNIQGGAADIKRQITELLTAAVHDSELSLGSQ